MNNDVIKVQLSCGVDYYKGDKGDKPIKGVDYFTQEDIADIVEQIETGGVDLDGYATKEYVDNAVSGVVVSETDPTVPAWAKQANKPSYTASEVGALPADTQLFSGNYNDLRNKPAIPTVPANVSAFNNDVGYLTSHQSLNDYATKSYVETAIRGAESGLLKRSVVQALPTNDIDEDTIYMVAKTGSTGDVYDEYLYVNSNWERIGSTDVDLTDYRKAVYLETSENLDADSIAILNEIYNHIVSLNLSNNDNSNVLPSYDIFVNGEHIEYFKKYNTTITLLTGFYGADNFQKHQYVWTKDETRLWANGVSSISGNNLSVENENSVAGAYPNNSIGRNFKYIKDNYAKLTDIPTVPPAPIVIQVGIAGQPSVDSNGNYRIPLAITSNNMAEAYAQYQTHPSTVGIAVDLSAMGISTKMYLDCESFYRYDDGNGGYNYEAYGEFNDSSIASFGFEFQNVNIYLNTETNSSEGRLIGITTVHQLASKANSADLATVATSGDYNDLTNKPTIPTAYTLPTATTSTLGGVKVDGTTITITDGVISTTSSGGGTAYTAGNGISISNNTISADTTVLATKAEIPAVSITETDGDTRGTLTIGNKSIIIGNGLMIEADADTGDGMLQCSLEVPEPAGRVEIFTTEDGYAETRKIIDGIGIGAGLDVVEGTDPYALPADEAGTQGYWLVATGNSSGTTYTAGDGINIDSNGVISAKPSYSGHYGINGIWSYWREKVNPNGGYMETTTVTSAEQAVEYLLKGFVIQQNSNIKIDLRDIIDIRPSDNNYFVVRFNLATKKIYDRSSYGASDNYQYTLSRFNYYVKLDNQTLLELTNVSTSTISPSGLLPYFIIHQSPNYTTYNVADNLDEVMETVNTRIPTAPTTDGNYVLKVSVSSGTPTYSWVAE